MSRKGIHFKVVARLMCDCGKPVALGSRKFCSRECRTQSYAGQEKYKKMWSDCQRNRRERIASVASPDKIKCLVCGRYYIKVGAHVWLKHRITARVYREEYDLPVKRGMVAKHHREVLAENVRANGTIENLKKGERFLFKKDDPRAKRNTFFKGQYQKVKRLSQEIYPH